ncbi:type 1 fimbrae adaptor subunit FimF [Enterobacter kobei]|nr:type 1 fimbrae adaptor subunit FimF [Enterobacter kobei]
MKTVLLILLLCFLQTLLPAVSRATTTSINVVGEILPETCDISTGDLRQSIDLGEFSVTNFPTTGSVTTPVQFSFNMTNCTAGISAANIRFSGPSVNSNLFSLQGSGDIALELLNPAGQTLVPGTRNRFSLAGGNNTLDFSMRLKSLRSPVTASDLSGTIFLDIEYE